jgi:hypothetical protein
MGGESLMKRLLITNALLSISLFASTLSMAEITNMVNKIKKEREGISLSTLESTENPFLTRKPVEKPVEELGELGELVLPAEINYALKAVFNRKAFIDDKWYKKGETIGGYTITNISSTSVVLESPSGNRVLNLEHKKKLIKLK